MTDLGDTPSDPSVGRYDKADEPPILRSSPGLPRSNTRSPGPRSPKLSSLPENSSPDTPGASLTQTDVADFAPPSRQYTDSTTTTSEFSFVPATNRSSAVPFYQHFHSPSGSEHQLQAANQILEQQLSSYRALKTSLKTVPAPPSSHPRLPKDEDFKEFPDVHKNLSWKIKVYSDKEPPHAVDITSIIILLHDHNGDESTLKAFTKKHLAQPQTALLFLGGLCRIRGPTNGEVFGLSWADESPDGIHYHDASRIILKHVIGRILVSKCNFSPSNIAILGQGQGGTLALTIASIWNTTRFGGVITVDGPAPEYTSQSPQLPRSPTPILILGGKLGLMNPQAEQRIKDLFTYVDTELRPGATSVRLSSTMSDEDEIETIHDFLDHSLRQQEWETQTILAFDGGGIKGYGSLLILKELMRRVGIYEKQLDTETQSSFSPGIYKPTEQASEQASEQGDRPQTGQERPVIATSTDGLDESDLFLPCHYFNYIGGTSTGGLISIMLSRFRMSVNDCIAEYKALGGKVFANPRPISKGGILWHKYNSDRLRSAIEDVTNRHCFRRARCFGIKFPSDPDLCRTVVLAYSEDGTTNEPYLFRTYHTFPHRQATVTNGEAIRPGAIRRPTTLALKNTKIPNPGEPSDVDIPSVGRATSAAPTYFAPVRIPITDKRGTRNVRFKDGGFGSNNPSPAIYRDVVHKHGGLSKSVSVFVSIGTGDSELRMFDQEGWTPFATRVREARANLKASLRLPARTKGAEEAMLGFAYRDNHAVFPYSRFDGGPRLGNVEMDEWKSDRVKNFFTGKVTVSGGKTLQEIRDAVGLYLADPAIQAELDDRAKDLVHRRRRRTRDKSKWDRYASASWYECQIGGCRDSTEYKTYTLFEEHVRNEHSRSFNLYDPGKFEEEALNHRKCWLYGKK